MTAQTIVTYLTPVIVPLVISGFKKLAPKIPSFVLPMIAPILGVVIDLINSYLTNGTPSLIVAAVLGLAGVGVREVVDQVKPDSDPDKVK